MSKNKSNTSYYTGRSFNKKAPKKDSMERNELPYTLGEHLVSDLKFRPSKAARQRYKKGEITWEELHRGEKVLDAIKNISRGITDAIVPSSPGSAALMGAGGAAAKGTYTTLARAGANIATHAGAGWGSKGEVMLRRMKHDPKAAYKAIRHDVPYHSKKTKTDTGDWYAGSQRYAEDEPLIDALMDPSEQAVLRFPERYYSFRRGVKGLKTDPKGFSNKRFLEKNPEYKEIADNWNKFKEKLIEYEMKDPTTGEILPHVAYKNLPKELRDELNKEVGQRSGHFGHMGFFKANKYPKKRFSEKDQLPYTEWIGRYEDKFDFNTKGENLWKRFLQGDPLFQRGKGAVGNQGYETTLADDLLTSVVESFMKPVVWKGEATLGRSLPGYAGRFKRMAEEGVTPVLRRKINTRKWGLDQSEVHALIKEFDNDPNKFYRNKDGVMSFFELRKPSKKQMSLGQRYRDLEERFRTTPWHTGVQRFGNKNPELSNIVKRQESPIFTNTGERRMGTMFQIK